MTERQVYLSHLRRLREENKLLRASLMAAMIDRINDRKEFQKWRKSRWTVIIDMVLYGVLNRT